MTNYENITKNKQSLINFLDKHCQIDGSPWSDWFDDNYCSLCEPIKTKCRVEKFYRPDECAYCEINGNCKFFKHLNEIPSNIEIIKMWLKQKAE